MKVTVYIPDDLMREARKLHDGEKTSQLVQRGLQRLLDDTPAESPSYAVRPEGVDEKIIALREKFLEEAERDYAIGYAAAVEIAEGLPLWSFNELARLNFNVAMWLKGHRRAALEEIYELHKDDEVEKISHEDLAQMSHDDIFQLLDSIKVPEPTPEESHWWWVWRLVPVLGVMADPIGYDEGSFTPTDARVRGFADGLRDLWDAVESPGSSRIDRAVEFEQKFAKARNRAGEPDALAQWKHLRKANQDEEQTRHTDVEEGGDDE
jgi:hypothetical protein